MILVIGCKGSMGKRYAAILQYLDMNFDGIDKNSNITMDSLRRYDAFILATPTETHFHYLMTLIPLGKPILVEKPVVTEMDQLEMVYRVADMYKTPITMMNQYVKLELKGSKGLSSYNYYHSGNDGLTWDCIQIIGLADGAVSIHDDSPIWGCVINGHKISKSDMDEAYVSFVQEWLNNPHFQDRGKILEAHSKTIKLLEAYESSAHCYSSSQ